VIEPNDPVWPRLQALSVKSKDDPMQWLTMDDIYGDVAKDETFRAAFAGWLNMLWRDGAARTLAKYITG
jgi:mannitol 2-dehydrogenase